MKFESTISIATKDLSINTLHGFRALLIGAAGLALVACGGGSGDSAAVFTVTATVGANGSVSAASTTVASGATTSLELTPDSNYTVDSASGCGGSLSGNTYTTGSVTTDCTVTISFRTREFVWKGGSNTEAARGNYGALGVAAASNVPGARDSGVSWMDADGKLWLFGGVGYTASLGGNLNDLWKYDPLTEQWTWMSGSSSTNVAGVYGSVGVEDPGNVPGSRGNAVSWTDASGNLWLFGGKDPNFNNLNDLWKYSPVSGQWTWMSGSSSGNATGVYGSVGVEDPANVPGARRSSAAWTDTNGNLWLFGGMDESSNFYNDLWKYSPSSGQWTWMSGSNIANGAADYGVQGVEDPGNIPSARRSTTYWADASGNLWLLGGMEENTLSFMNDLWKYNIASGQWTWMSGTSTANATSDYGVKGVAAASNVPGGRSSSVAWIDASGKLWMFGGYGYDASFHGLLRDLWRYDPDSGQWTWMNGSNTVGTTGVYGDLGTPDAGNVPGGRYDAVSWIDDDGNPWLFGGYNDNDDLNDLWSYN